MTTTETRTEWEATTEGWTAAQFAQAAESLMKDCNPANTPLVGFLAGRYLALTTEA